MKKIILSIALVCSSILWAGTEHFTQDIYLGDTVVVAEIPKNIENLEISLISDKDLDIQLYGEGGTALVAYKNGLLNGAGEDNVTYHSMTIKSSGYNGTNVKAGHEYIKVTGKTTEKLTMKVYGYEAGTAKVNYSWGIKEDYIVVLKDYNTTTESVEERAIRLLSQVSSSVESLGSIYTSIFLGFSTNLTRTEKEVLEQFPEINSIEKDGLVCPVNYAPVCGITNPCPPAGECLIAPIYKTFSNMCMLEVANAEFSHQGECKQSYEKNITIKSKKVECTGFMVPSTKCLQLQEEGSNIWDIVYGIKGLAYEEGYKYKILAKVTKSDPNIMDAPSKFYSLIKILKKDLVDDNGMVCPANYAPVCGSDPLVDCPEDNQTCNQKTYGNMCQLEVAKANFLYKGECKKDPIDEKGILYVGPTTFFCIALDGVQCPTYEVKYNEEDEWKEVFYTIKGFNHKYPYQYKLSVEKIIEVDDLLVPNDTSAKYKLLTILEQTLVVPENCIAWYDGCNNCTKEIGCTEMSCLVYGDFKCTKYKWNSN